MVGMNFNERALSFACRGEPMVGVLALPASAPPAVYRTTSPSLRFGTDARERTAGTTVPSSAPDTAVVIIVGGPQYRAGSHRQFVLLARRLAANGWPALRFDVRGMGDSAGTPLPFDALDDDIGAAVDAVFAALPTLRRVVLWGLCDGASAALLSAGRRKDLRIGGLCLLNPWVRSTVSLARTHVKHYYADRLRQPDFWRKLVRGGISLQATHDLLRSLSSLCTPKATRALKDDFRDQMAAAWAAFPGELLLLLSGADYTAREFVETTSTEGAWQGSMELPTLRQVHIDAADHTFSDPGRRVEMESAVLDWLGSQFLNERPFERTSLLAGS